MIRLSNVSKVFGTGVAGLSDVSLVVEPGEFVFLVGHTGSGKTTLLRLLVRDMLPTSGDIVVGEYDLMKLPAGKVPDLRKKIGIVFQDLKLLMDRTILENILLPMEVAGIDTSEAMQRATELLEKVGLVEHKEKFPVQLSGGELQRVAIARALTLAPEILLADEPTGNLDPETALGIVTLLDAINKAGTIVIMATHNVDIVQKMAKRVVSLEKGRIVKDEKKTTTEKKPTSSSEKHHAETKKKHHEHKEQETVEKEEKE